MQRVIVEKLRRRLKCGEKFPSSGPGNRICPVCHRVNQSKNLPSDRMRTRVPRALNLQDRE